MMPLHTLPTYQYNIPGQDLLGNTYWEFRPTASTTKFRRIVKYPRNTFHSDVQVSPMWHQWLKYTRADPPSLQEQTEDVLRMQQLKYNARLADERWEQKARYIEKPKVEEGGEEQTMEGGVKGRQKEGERGGGMGGKQPGEEWKPDAWVPGESKR
jgi:NADH dehydrogenase [ubiquinone] 1 alpha subcomplex assembly factor 2